jgi:predicted alpha-1,6-mannanase (GH76 family)
MQAMRARPLGTPKKVWDLHFELYRRLTGEQRVEIARQMTLAWQRYLFNVLRAKHPDLPDDEIWLKLAARRLGRDVVRKVYGRDIDPE